MTTTMHECDNCDWTGTEEQLHCVLADMPDLFERIAPGRPVPSGECPKCQACCYPCEERPTADEKITALVNGCQSALAYLADPPSPFWENRAAAVRIIREALELAKSHVTQPLVLG